jgi:hypothetical protein
VRRSPVKGSQALLFLRVAHHSVQEIGGKRLPGMRSIALNALLAMTARLARRISIPERGKLKWVVLPYLTCVALLARSRLPFPLTSLFSVRTFTLGLFFSLRNKSCICHSYAKWIRLLQPPAPVPYNNRYALSCFPRSTGVRFCEMIFLGRNEPWLPPPQCLNRP